MTEPQKGDHSECGVCGVNIQLTKYGWMHTELGHGHTAIPKTKVLFVHESIMKAKELRDRDVLLRLQEPTEKAREIFETLKAEPRMFTGPNAGEVKIKDVSIICPSCNKETIGKIETCDNHPFSSQSAECTHCQYIITESEWNENGAI